MTGVEKLSGKVVLVDDEPFEEDLLRQALSQLNIRVDLKFFRKPQDALNYLATTTDDIFIVISDMNMPGMDGLEFKRTIDSDRNLQEKAIPFIFSTNGATRKQLEEAYQYRLQGYFKKPDDVFSMAKQLELVLNYWILSLRPDNINDGKITKVKIQ